MRIGIHVSPLVTDEHDIYGHGVNLAARLTTLAGPGEIVVSADVRDQLTPALDADIEDLGECYVKHVQQPVRAFRVGAPGEQPVIERGNMAEDLRATIAVIPFRPRTLQPTDDVLGQLLADEVISALSHSPEVNVVSRLSTTAFQGREVKLDDVSAYLRADYVVSGSYHVDGDRVTLKAELAETRSMKVVWTQTLKGSVQGIVSGDDPLAGHLVNEACAAMMVRELQRSQGKAPQSLQNHTLLLSSITLMHRISPLAFQRAQQMLQVLIERTPRLASPYAWLAKWHVLRVTQGWSADAQADGKAALDNTKRALDRDATSSLAMTVEGQVNTYILKRLDVAEQFYAQALQSNPNDSLAWLLKGTLHAFRDEGKEAVRHTRHALKLSPLDPLKYYFDSLAATAALSAGQYRAGAATRGAVASVEPDARIDASRDHHGAVPTGAYGRRAATCSATPYARTRIQCGPLFGALARRSVQVGPRRCIGARGGRRSAACMRRHCPMLRNERSTMSWLEGRRRSEARRCGRSRRRRRRRGCGGSRAAKARVRFRGAGPSA